MDTIFAFFENLIFISLHIIFNFIVLSSMKFIVYVQKGDFFA